MKIRLNDNHEIPQIGVGTWTLRGETARQNVRLALEAGFRHIDTAHHDSRDRYIDTCMARDWYLPSRFRIIIQAYW